MPGKEEGRGSRHQVCALQGGLGDRPVGTQSETDEEHLVTQPPTLMPRVFWRLPDGAGSLVTSPRSSEHCLLSHPRV